MPPATRKPIQEIPFKGFFDTKDITFTGEVDAPAFTFYCATPAEEIKAKYFDAPRCPKIKCPGMPEVDAAKAIAEAESRRFGAGVGAILQLSSVPNTFLFGMGKVEEGKPTSRVTANKLALALATFVNQQRPESVNFNLECVTPCAFPYFVAYLRFALYIEDRFRRANAKSQPIKSTFGFPAQEAHSLVALMEEADHLADALLLKREIGDAPPNYCHPESFKDVAEAMCKEVGNLTFSAMDFQQCLAMGMGGFCAVSQGMTNEPYFLQMKYKKGVAKQRFALVGKGVCMDTGGYALKSCANMINMHHDMGGAAVTLAVAKLIALTQPDDLEVDFFIPLVENLVDAQAYLNGDVITTMSGLKVMINNTDAEGRMILCDGITFAQKMFKDENETRPRTIATIATLTGAAVVALGDKMAPFYTNNDVHAAKVKNASDMNPDKVWRMPLTSEYNFMDGDDRGDLVNVVFGGKNGSVNAAKFLEAFCDDEDVEFMHFDIAGPYTNAKSQSDIYGPVLMRDIITRICKE